MPLLFAISSIELHREAHNWPSVVQVRGWFARVSLLDSSHSSDSLWRSGRLQAHPGRQLDGVSSGTLVRLASRLSRQVLTS